MQNAQSTTHETKAIHPEAATAFEDIQRTFAAFCETND